MDEPKRLVTDPQEMVKEVFEDSREGALRTTQYAVETYIREKRTMARKLDHVKRSGKLDRDHISGDYQEKIKKVFARLEELQVTGIKLMVGPRNGYRDMDFTCRFSGRAATMSFYRKAYGPECTVYVTKKNPKHSWDSAARALHIHFGSKNMLVKNYMLDVALGE